MSGCAVDIDFLVSEDFALDTQLTSLVKGACALWSPSGILKEMPLSKPSKYGFTSCGSRIGESKNNSEMFEMFEMFELSEIDLYRIFLGFGIGGTRSSLGPAWKSSVNCASGNVAVGRSSKSFCLFPPRMSLTILKSLSQTLCEFKEMPPSEKKEPVCRLWITLSKRGEKDSGM